MLKLVHWNNPALSRMDVWFGNNKYVVDHMISMEDYNESVEHWKGFSKYVAIWCGTELLFYGESKYLPLISEPKDTYLQQLESMIMESIPSIDAADKLYEALDDAVNDALNSGVLTYNTIIGTLENIKLNVYSMIPIIDDEGEEV